MTPRWWRRRHRVDGTQEGQPPPPDSPVLEAAARRIQELQERENAAREAERQRRLLHESLQRRELIRRQSSIEDLGDADFLRQWLCHGSVADMSFRSSRAFHGYGRFIESRRGGYKLLWRDRGGVFLNVSIASMVHPEMVNSWRDMVLRIAEEVGVPVIPIAEPPWAVLRNRVQGDAVLVARSSGRGGRGFRGLEAVFRLGDRYFLSAYDEQEDPPLYFLCALPRAVETVEEARESLKPASVLAAEANGIEVRRQGDLFAIHSDLTVEQIRAAGGKLFPTPGVQEIIPIYGTAHVGAKTAVMPGNIIMASGALYHRPEVRGERRQPDHRPLSLGSDWWWIARNTVPIESRTDTPREYGPRRPASPLFLMMEGVEVDDTMRMQVYQWGGDLLWR